MSGKGWMLAWRRLPDKAWECEFHADEKTATERASVLAARGVDVAVTEVKTWIVMQPRRVDPANYTPPTPTQNPRGGV